MSQLGLAILDGTYMPSSATLRFRIRIDKDEDIAIGPGKIALLEAIIATGSITAAAKKLRMGGFNDQVQKAQPPR